MKERKGISEGAEEECNQSRKKRRKKAERRRKKRRKKEERRKKGRRKKKLGVQVSYNQSKRAPARVIYVKF